MTEPTQAAEMTKLLALDEEDLAVLSATFQDAIVRVGDMAFLPKEKRFALVGARLDWIAALRGHAERCWAGLHFERVRKVACTSVPRERPETMLNLLAIRFRATDAPSGEIVLTFSGGAAVKLDVECIEAQMRDTGPRWRAKALPGHPIEEIGEDSTKQGNP